MTDNEKWVPVRNDIPLGNLSASARGKLIQALKDAYLANRKQGTPSDTLTVYFGTNGIRYSLNVPADHVQLTPQMVKRGGDQIYTVDLHPESAETIIKWHDEVVKNGKTKHPLPHALRVQSPENAPSLQR
jgi:hypothetical protein